MSKPTDDDTRYRACVYTRDGGDWPIDFATFSEPEALELLDRAQDEGFCHYNRDGSWGWFPPSMIRRIEFDPIPTDPEDDDDDEE
jgi:hypothetical protein